MGVSERISRDLALVRSEEFAAMCRTRPQDFTRRRKLPCDRLAETLLARKGRTLSIELRDVRREVGVNVSKTGYLKARSKLNPKALLELARNHAASVYADGDFETLAGMVVVAVDGSSALVPTNEETLALYGNASGSGRPQATIGVSGAHDPLTSQIIDVSLHRGSFDERAQVMGHLLVAERVTHGMPLLLLGDRGYPSLLLMAQLECAGARYLLRCNSYFLRPEFRAAEAAGGDLWVDVGLTRKRLRKTALSDPAAADALEALGTLRVRFALVDIGGDSPELVVTNVPEDVLPHDGLKAAYWDRWPIETCFEFMKDRLQMENFTGTRPVLIEQDVYATAYLTNVAFDLAREAEAEARDRIAGSGTSYKHEMAVNRTFAIGALKEDLYRLILADEVERGALMAALVEEVSRQLVPIRPDRPTYSRDGLSSPRAGKYSNTHRRAF